jgi:hypothetical protein
VAATNKAEQIAPSKTIFPSGSNNSMWYIWSNRRKGKPCTHRQRSRNSLPPSGGHMPISITITLPTVLKSLGLITTNTFFQHCHTHAISPLPLFCIFICQRRYPSLTPSQVAPSNTCNLSKVPTKRNYYTAS